MVESDSLLLAYLAMLLKVILFEKYFFQKWLINFEKYFWASISVWSNFYKSSFKCIFLKNTFQKSILGEKLFFSAFQKLILLLLKILFSF